MKVKSIILVIIIICLVCGCHKQRPVADAHMLIIIVDIKSIDDNSMTTNVVIGNDKIKKGEEIILNFTDSEDLKRGIEKHSLEKGERIIVYYLKVINLDNKKTIKINKFENCIHRYAKDKTTPIEVVEDPNKQ